MGTVVIGNNARSPYSNCVVLGAGAVATDTEQFTVGFEGGNTFSTKFEFIAGTGAYNSAAGHLVVELGADTFYIPLFTA